MQNCVLGTASNFYLGTYMHLPNLSVGLFTESRQCNSSERNECIKLLEFPITLDKLTTMFNLLALWVSDVDT